MPGARVGALNLSSASTANNSIRKLFPNSLFTFGKILCCIQYLNVVGAIAFKAMDSSFAYNSHKFDLSLWRYKICDLWCKNWPWIDVYLVALSTPIESSEEAMGVSTLQEKADGVPHNDNILDVLRSHRRFARSLPSNIRDTLLFGCPVHTFYC